KGTAALASYTLIKQLVVFLFPGVMLGLQTGVPRYVAIDREREGAAERYLLSALCLTGAAATLLSCLLLVSPKATSAVLFGHDQRTSLVVPLVATLFATMTFEITYGYYRGRSEFKLASAARVVSVATLPVVLVLVAPHKPIGELMTLMAIGLLIA